MAVFDAKHIEAIQASAVQLQSLAAHLHPLISHLSSAAQPMYVNVVNITLRNVLACDGGNEVVPLVCLSSVKALLYV